MLIKYLNNCDITKMLQNILILLLIENVFYYYTVIK